MNWQGFPRFSGLSRGDASTRWCLGAFEVAAKLVGGEPGIALDACGWVVNRRARGRLLCVIANGNFDDDIFIQAHADEGAGGEDRLLALGQYIGRDQRAGAGGDGRTRRGHRRYGRRGDGDNRRLSNAVRPLAFKFALRPHGGRGTGFAGKYFRKGAENGNLFAAWQLDCVEDDGQQPAFAAIPGPVDFPQMAVNPQSPFEHLRVLDGNGVNQRAQDAVAGAGEFGTDGGMELKLEFRAFRDGVFLRVGRSLFGLLSDLGW